MKWATFIQLRLLGCQTIASSFFVFVVMLWTRAHKCSYILYIHGASSNLKGSIKGIQENSSPINLVCVKQKSHSKQSREHEKSKYGEKYQSNSQNGNIHGFFLVLIIMKKPSQTCLAILFFLLQTNLDISDTSTTSTLHCYFIAFRCWWYLTNFAEQLLNVGHLKLIEISQRGAEISRYHTKLYNSKMQTEPLLNKKGLTRPAQTKMPRLLNIKCILDIQFLKGFFAKNLCGMQTKLVRSLLLSLAHFRKKAQLVAFWCLA